MTASFRTIAATFAAVMVYCLLVSVAPKWVFRSTTSVETGGTAPLTTTMRDTSLVSVEP